MLINVYHRDMEKIDSNVFEKVATVDVDVMRCEEALEYAYRWTNNVAGSWSRKIKEFDTGEENGDYNDRVKVLTSLHEIDGKTFGLRSTSMGDQMEVVETGERFVVGLMGFERIEK